MNEPNLIALLRGFCTAFPIGRASVECDRYGTVILHATAPTEGREFRFAWTVWAHRNLWESGNEELLGAKIGNGCMTSFRDVNGRGQS